MEFLTNWNALSSGDGANGVTKVPGALLGLLKTLGGLAENLQKLIGLVA